MSDSIPFFANYLKTMIETNKGTLGVVDVYYGDQNKIPRTPTTCVDTGEKQRQLNGAPRRTENNITIYVVVYHYKVGSSEENQLGADNLAEAHETLIHADPQMGSNAIHSLVTSIEAGFAQRGRDTYRASRLTVEIRSQSQLPAP